MNREPLEIRRIDMPSSDARRRQCCLYVLRQGGQTLCIKGRGWRHEDACCLPCPVCLPPEEVDGTDDLSRQWYLRLLTYYKLLLDRGGLTVEEAATLSPAAANPSTAQEEARACLSYLADEGYALPPCSDAERYRPGTRRITDQ